jgi:hypothetical protein
MTRLLLAVALVALFASGCGGADRDPNLAEAVEKTETTGSSSFALYVLDADFAGGRRAFECRGIADYAAKRMRLECGDDGEFVAIENVYYVSGWSAGFGVPPGKPWIRIPIEEDDSPHDFAPATLLAKVRAANVETKRLGEEEVRGERTIHYRMTVTCTAADLDCPGETTDVEVWIDGDGLVRRVTMQDGTADVTAEFFDFGRSIDIASPPDSQVADIDNPPVDRCPGGGRPISDAQLQGALRAHDLEVPDGDDGECYSGVAAKVFAFVDGAHPSVVACYVFADDTGGPTRIAEESRGGLIGLQLRNVACSTYEKSSATPAVVRLRAALADLEPAVRP